MSQVKNSKQNIGEYLYLRDYSKKKCDRSVENHYSLLRANQQGGLQMNRTFDAGFKGKHMMH